MPRPPLPTAPPRNAGTGVPILHHPHHQVDGDDLEGDIEGRGVDGERAQVRVADNCRIPSSSGSLLTGHAGAGCSAGPRVDTQHAGEVAAHVEQDGQSRPRSPA